MLQAHSMHVHAVIVSVHEGTHYMYTHGGRTEERRWESPLQGVAGGQHAKKSRNQDTQEQEHAANTDLAMLLIHDDGLQFIRLVQHLSRVETPAPNAHPYTDTVRLRSAAEC